MKLETQQGPKSMLEDSKEARVLIKNNATGQAKVRPNMIEGEVCSLNSIGSPMTGKKKRHLRKKTNEYPNNIVFAESGRNTTQKIHGNGFSRVGGHG
jgi:hypothetical protein